MQQNVKCGVLGIGFTSWDSALSAVSVRVSVGCKGVRFVSQLWCPSSLASRTLHMYTQVVTVPWASRSVRMPTAVWSLDDDG